MGIVKLVAGILAAVVLLVVGVGAYAYFTDYAVEADVTAKGQDDGGYYVVLTPKLYAYDYKQYLDHASWSAVCKGNYVEFHVNSRHYALYTEKGGELVYDSEKGLVSTGAAFSCAAFG